MNAPPLQLKVALVTTMYELLDTTEHKSIGSKTRLGGGPNTPEVIGTVRSHRPDLFAKNPRGKLVLVETVTNEDMKDLDKLKDKLYLFYTASQCYGWDFHLACFAGLAVHLKHFCKKNEIRYSKIWTL